MDTRLVPQLRIAVNDRCQKACFYCRPAGEGSEQSARGQLSIDDIAMVVRQLAELGICDLKLTGGDPALRGDIVELVAVLKSIPGINMIEMVTRHPRAGDLARDLASAGLDCLNFSLDTLRPQRYRLITGVGGHGILLDAIKTSVPVSQTVKINTVVLAGVNHDEMEDLIDFCEAAGVGTLKFLDLIVGLDTGTDSYSHRLRHFMPNKTLADLYYPLDKYCEKLVTRAVSAEVQTQHGGLGHPMQTFKLRSGLQIQIKDARRGAWYGDICRACSLYPCHDAIMALRLTSDGKLQQCLARDDNVIDVLTPLRANRDLGSTLSRILNTYATATFEARPRIAARGLGASAQFEL